MGLSVSPSSLHKKQTGRVKHQEQGKKDVLTDYVTYVESQNKNSGTEGIEGPEVEIEDQGIAEIDIPVTQPCKPIGILGGGGGSAHSQVCLLLNYMHNYIYISLQYRSC